MPGELRASLPHDALGSARLLLPAIDPLELLERTFEEVEGYDEMVLLRDIRFESHCEHHMAPIIGRAHVGYFPDRRVVGIGTDIRWHDRVAPGFADFM